MDNNFNILEYDEVVQIQEPLRILSGDPTCKTGEVIAAVMFLLKQSTDPFNKTKIPPQNPEDGIKAQVLTYQAKGWQKGRIRIRFEFCPDDPDVEEIAVPQEPELPSEPESPLDEIRRMIDEPNS